MRQPLFKSTEKEHSRFPEIDVGVQDHPSDQKNSDHADFCNLTLSDSLGLASDQAIMKLFFNSFLDADGSSELMPSGSEVNREKCFFLEQLLKARYGAERVLVFGSAYQANVGILPAVAETGAEVFIDQHVHATLADGLRLSGVKHQFFSHKNLAELRQLLSAPQAKNPEMVKIVVTESIFSEEGDVADLRALVALKREQPNVLLYVDEAQAVGIRGPSGLGIGEETGTLGDIDFLVGVFGKALASNGAFVVTSQRVRKSWIENIQALSVDTALSPVNLRWTNFIVEALPEFEERRQRLMKYGQTIAAAVRTTGRPCVSASHIVSITFESRAESVEYTQMFADAGFYVLPSCSKVIPNAGSHIRLSLSAGMASGVIDRLACLIENLA